MRLSRGIVTQVEVNLLSTESMARSLEFTVNGETFSCELNTVDRAKLYGSVTTETLDQEGRRCELATLAVDGKTLIHYGGTAAGYVNNDGDWISRKNLVAVNAAGDVLPEVESSFKHPVDLSRRVTVEEYLDHSVRLIYALKQSNDIPKAMLDELGQGAIFRFEFSYRGGVDADPAFILMDKQQALWMLVAENTEIQFTGLEQAAICATTASVDTDESAEDESLDFSML